jgi:hypothetical protein
MRFCEKVAQNVSKCIFCENYYIAFYRGKSSPIILATSLIFTKTTQIKQSPKRPKIAQSVHPDRRANGGSRVRAKKNPSLAQKTNKPKKRFSSDSGEAAKNFFNVSGKKVCGQKSQTWILGPTKRFRTQSPKTSPPAEEFAQVHALRTCTCRYLVTHMRKT